MLPPRLAGIKRRIESKPSHNRTVEEEELLAELISLDSKITSESIEFGEYRRKTAVIAGPGGSCPCCGR